MSKRIVNLSLLHFILAVLLTVWSSYRPFNKRVVADCFAQTVELTNLSGTYWAFIGPGMSRSAVLAEVTLAPYLNADINGTPIDPSIACPSTNLFCCVRFSLTANSMVPVTQINGISGRWKVQEVYFKN